MFDHDDRTYAESKLAEIALACPELYKEGYGHAGVPAGEPLTAVDPSEFLRAVTFLRQVKAVKTPNRNRTSHGYRLVAERWWQKHHADNPSISNGAFIAAALALGFTTRRINNNRNALIGISQRSLRALER